MWRKVIEGLPIRMEPVWTWDGEEVRRDRLENEDPVGWMFRLSSDRPVTHWMYEERPDPPKEG